MKKLFFLIVLIMLAAGSNAQMRFYVLPAAANDQAILAEKELPDSVQAEIIGWKIVQELIGSLQQQGYLEAYIVKREINNFKLAYTVAVGKRYSWLSLSANRVSARVWRQAGYRPSDFATKPFNYTRLARLLNGLVSISEDNGYPFAQAYLDSVTITNGEVQAVLVLEQGTLITFDSIIVEGNARLSSKFIQSYLGINYGKPYSQKKINQVGRRLQQLPYIKVLGPAHLSFENNRARLYIKLERQAANQFEGLVALQSKPEGGTLLTGQVDMLLQNPFGGGKKLALNWRRLNTSSQQLQIAYRQPYLFGSPLSLQGSFSLYKEAEIFLNRNLEAAAEMQQASGAVFSVLVQQRDTRLLDDGSQPELASFRINLYGLGFGLNTANQVVFPTAGWYINSNFLVGPKKIRNLPRGYENTDVPKNSFVHATINLDLHRYIQVANNSVLVIKAKTGWLYDKYLFLPDLYRLGGLYSLRGFREQSVLANQYAVVQTELRQRIGKSSYIFALYDQAYTNRYTYATAPQLGWPLGLGAGLSLNSAAGLFNLVYAVGKPAGQALSGQNSQVHFGYISRF